DVTRQAKFLSNLDVVARVDENGLVTAGQQRGDAAIMAQFLGRVAVFNAIVPHGTPLADIPGFAANNYVDQLAVDKWKKLGRVPANVCDDTTFLRRVTVDVCGRLPQSDEVREFLVNNSANKR